MLNYISVCISFLSLIMNDLPEPIFDAIMDYVSYALDGSRAKRVCKKWNQVIGTKEQYGVKMVVSSLISVARNLKGIVKLKRKFTKEDYVTIFVTREIDSNLISFDLWCEPECREYVSLSGKSFWRNTVNLESKDDRFIEFMCSVTSRMNPINNFSGFAANFDYNEAFELIRYALIDGAFCHLEISYDHPNSQPALEFPSMFKQGITYSHGIDDYTKERTSSISHKAIIKDIANLDISQFIALRKLKHPYLERSKEYHCNLM